VRKKESLVAVILAAGDGTRMLSQIPKVAHSLYGKPLIGHVLDAVREAGIQRMVVVVGYRSKLVEAHLGKGVETVVQHPLRGTAHAVRQTLPRLKGFRGDLLVLYGDTPLLTARTLEGLVETHRQSKAACTLLTAHLSDPAGYGRVIRDQTGRIVRIVEDADATQAERAVEEINVGAYCFQIKVLTWVLPKIRPAANGEYYLTDAIAHLVRAGATIASASTRSVGEFLGINTRADLARVQTIMRSRILERFMLAGVTIVDPYTTYIDGSASIGQDTIVYPHTVIEANTQIGRRCRIGPFSHLGPNTVVGDGAVVGSFVALAHGQVRAGEKIFRDSSGCGLGSDSEG
jgi:bifunctional UDP-N-acetylglucosamine pyrophosphorylase/glucosamine-1-phosphate N-acetyltransferase